MTPETQTALRERLSDEQLAELLEWAQANVNDLDPHDDDPDDSWPNMLAALSELQQHRALLPPEPAAGQVQETSLAQVEELPRYGMSVAGLSRCEVEVSAERREDAQWLWRPDVLALFAPQPVPAQDGPVEP